MNETTDKKATFADIEKFVRNWAPEGMPERGAKNLRTYFVNAILPEFKTITEFTTADPVHFGKTNAQRIGVATIRLWDDCKDFVREKTREALKAQAVEIVQKTQQELEDPFISADMFLAMATFCEQNKLPGLRYRRFLKFVECVLPDCGEQAALRQIIPEGIPQAPCPAPAALVQ